MAHSVEARVPFCDFRLTNFLSRVPYKYKIKWKSIFSKLQAFFSLSDVHSEKLNDSKYILRKLSTKYISKVFVSEMIDRIITKTHSILNSLHDGSVSEETLSKLSKFEKRMRLSTNNVQLKRNIAEYIFEQKKYPY